MTLRDKVTTELLNKHPISQSKQNPEYSFYYKDYNDNLLDELGPDAFAAYDKGDGAETKETYNKRYNKIVPPKMASVASSSAMTFNLLGNEPIVISANYKLPCSNDRLPIVIPAGKYNVIYEKQMYTLNAGSNPANLDAFLFNEEEKTAIFCEMKNLEWLNSPGLLKDTYCDKSNFFEPKYNAGGSKINAFDVFKNLINQIKFGSKPDSDKEGHELLISKYDTYDAWQMLKHTLAIYNYTSFVTQDSVCSFQNGKIPSMAGKFDRIILLNVVNELPEEWIENKKTKDQYIKRKNTEKEQSHDFIDLMMNPNNKLRQLFDNNCNAEFEIAYMSAKEFANVFDMTAERRKYLNRYFD